MLIVHCSLSVPPALPEPEGAELYAGIPEKLAEKLIVLKTDALDRHYHALQNYDHCIPKQHYKKRAQIAAYRPG
jgi:hypothetical protein